MTEIKIYIYCEITSLSKMSPTLYLFMYFIIIIFWFSYP